MLEKFKKLSKGKKIIVGITAFILLPITLLALGVDLFISGLKNKKRGKIVGGIALTIFMLFMFVPSKNADTDIAENDNEILEVENNQTIKEVIEEDPTSLNVTIEESIEEKDGKIRLNIKTNLPNTTELIVSVSERNGDYKGETKAIVTNGEAQTEWFSNKGEPLKRGDYYLLISMSIPSTQSEEVQKIVGKNGEYLEGDLVITNNGSSYIAMDTIITIEGDSSSEEKVKQGEAEEQVKIDNQGVDTTQVKTRVNSIIMRELNDSITNTTLKSVQINENLGTDANNDVVVLVNLSWSTKNLEKMTREMLEMYSDYLAATLSSELAEGSEIALFWKAEYTGLDIKHSYYIKEGNAYKQ